MQARIADPHSVEGLDEYALLLHQKGRPGSIAELNMLTADALAGDPQRPEPWLCYALFWKARGDPARALEYAHKVGTLLVSHSATGICYTFVRPCGYERHLEAII